MVILQTYKNEEDPIKNEGTKNVHIIIHWFFRCSRTANSEVSGEIWSKFKLIKACMHVSLTCKNEDPIKIESAGVLTTLLPF